jgi:hypothetical protein
MQLQLHWQAIGLRRGRDGSSDTRAPQSSFHYRFE